MTEEFLKIIEKAKQENRKKLRINISVDKVPSEISKLDELEEL